MPVSDAHLRHLRTFLDPGEEVVWAGQPSPSRAFRSAMRVWLFAIPWTAFALFWMAAAGAMTWFGPDTGASREGIFGFFPLFGIPFVLVGLGMLASPYWAWRAAQKTVYVVTNRRALVGTPAGGGVTFASYRPDELTDLTLTVRDDGSGTVALREEPLNLRGGNTSTPLRARADAFADIPDVEHVFGLLRRLAQTAPGTHEADARQTAFGGTFDDAVDDAARAYGADDDRNADFARAARQNAPGWRERPRT